jgi:predicted RNA-binding protein with RPS1 domain
VADVVRPYGEMGLVHIADTIDQFVWAAESALEMDQQTRAAWLARVDAFLAGSSWDLTWQRMDALIEMCLA